MTVRHTLPTPRALIRNLLLASALLFSTALRAEPATPPALSEDGTFAVVVYNVENLFDLDGVALYDDYQPATYTPEHLRVKIVNIAQVMARLDKGAGPAIIAFNEIEVDQTPESTVTDYAAWLKSVSHLTLAEMTGQNPLSPEFAGLPAEAWLLKAFEEAGLTGYHVATTDDRPPTAVRNLVFSRFPITDVRSHALVGARAILEVTVNVVDSPLTLFASHWKSGASNPETEEIRRGNARVHRARLDELLSTDPNADILVTGDLNSHYNQKQRYRELRVTAINDILGSQGNELALRGSDRDLYNLWFELPSDQRGSDTFRGEWGTLMHLILTRGLYDQNGIQYMDNSFAVLKITGLNANSLGLPNRWSRGRVPGGFSDHFPLYARFRHLGPGPRDKWIALTNPSTTPDGTGTTLSTDVSPVDLFKTALQFSDLPKDADIRDGTYNGRIFYIDEKCYLNDRDHVKVMLGGLEYDVFSHRAELRDRMRNRVREGKHLRFYGELGQYRGNWQFVIQGKEWLKSM